MNYNKAEFFTSCGLTKQLPAPDRAEIAFSGRSNVGKSSLINKLLNRKSLARVSGVPGKTITVNFYTVDEIYFVDLPGYGYAKASRDEQRRWSGLVDGYFAAPRGLRLVVQLIDFRHKPSADDMMMLDYLRRSGRDFIIALTKADKLKKTEREKRRAALVTELAGYEDIKKFELSSQNGEGIDELKAYLESVLDA
ncbi:MAG: YihA family ribosome biogenesis GTP-binding protein [Eubacterium sp.]|nr:YihA family ribosome biogenesis GTP-binding protein [Eubacterium sp.]